MTASVIPDQTVTATFGTRRAIARVLLENGALTALDIAQILQLTAAGIRRHLDHLVESGDITAAPAPRATGRGRPARRFTITEKGREAFGHSYHTLAADALEQLEQLGGKSALRAFAQRRVDRIVGEVSAAESREQVPEVAEDIARAFTDAGYATTVTEAGAGLQICQHHCPVSHVAKRFPELCEAEREAVSSLLGLHIQPLASIADGNCVCTTHIPLDRIVVDPASTPVHDDRSERGQ